MTIGQLPYQLPTSTGWTYVQTVVDHIQTSPNPSSGASSQVQAELKQVPGNEIWLVQRIAVQCSLGAPTFTAYINQVNAQSIADSTAAGADDVADEHQPIVLKPTDTMLLVWSGCPTGAICSASVQRAVYRQQG